jgi:hypothetical protein
MSKKTSPYFSSFRELLDKWDENIEKEKELDKITDEDDISFFFTLNDEVYGGTEDSRLAFARMKSPEEEDKAWAKESTFIGINLKKLVNGNKEQKIFSQSDLKKIKPISKKDAFKNI